MIWSHKRQLHICTYNVVKLFVYFASLKKFYNKIKTELGFNCYSITGYLKHLSEKLY